MRVLRVVVWGLVMLGFVGRGLADEEQPSFQLPEDQLADYNVGLPAEQTVSVDRGHYPCYIVERTPREFRFTFKRSCEGVRSLYE